MPRVKKVQYDRRAVARSVKSMYGKMRSAGIVDSRRSVAEIKRIALSAGEAKKLQVAITQDAFDVPNYITLNAVGQGDDTDDREGSRITMIGLEIRIAFTAISTTTNPTFGFWAIVLDRQNAGGGAPAVSDIYDYAAGDPAFALRKQEETARYRVLYREDFAVGTSTADAGGMITFHKYLDLNKMLDEKDKRVRFSATAASYTSIGNNGLFLIVCPSNQANFSEGTNYHRFTGWAALTYRDF